MRSIARFVSIITLGSGLLAACNLSDGPTSPTGALLDGAVAATSRDAPVSGNKLAMCHLRADGTYHRIDPASPAAPAHRAHGDAAVGENVPGAALMVFDEACAQVPKTFVITSGSWVIDNLWKSQFDVSGPELWAKGAWYFAVRLGVCTLGGCTGQTTAVDALFDNPYPDTQYPQAPGHAKVGNTTYSQFPIEFGGPLRFVSPAFTIPAPEPGGYAVNIQVPFTMTGHLKGYLVAGRRDPLLAFDVPVSGHGTATLLFVAGAFWTLRFDFQE